MLKRFFDLGVAGLALLLLSPVLLAIALAVKLDSPGPVFYRQERVGRHGRTFRIFKFRTMTVQQRADAAQITATGDDRITRSGRFLRRTKLDELAQLIDVLRGTMSLVGPRPEVPRYVDHYPAQWRERLLSVRPGITDFASVRYRDEGDLLAQAEDPEREYLDVILPTKLRYALRYVDQPTLANDLRVLGLTLTTVFVPSFPSPMRFLPMNDSKLWSWLDQSMTALRPRNRSIAMVVDAVTVLVCWHLTYLFRLGFERWQPGRPWYDDYVSFGVVIIYCLMLMVMGVPRGLWRFFGFEDFKRIAGACFVAGLVSAVIVLSAKLSGVARAVLLLHPLFCTFALCLLRMGYRMVSEQARSRVGGERGETRRAVVLGAGEAARRLVSAIHRREGWTILALLDDDLAKQGLRIGGVSVQGVIGDLALPHLRAGVTHVIVAMPGASALDRERALALARHYGLPVLNVPSRMELQDDNGLSPVP
jgi:lipopolysaccharide/colanic/teichoic acid biosynthesis glycosyltransferase